MKSQNRPTADLERRLEQANKLMSPAVLGQQMAGPVHVEVDSQRDRIVAFAAQNKLPAMYQFREYAVAGGLITCSPVRTR
jgi:hypothetical protein